VLTWLANPLARGSLLEDGPQGKISKKPLTRRFRRVQERPWTLANGVPTQDRAKASSSTSRTRARVALTCARPSAGGPLSGPFGRHSCGGRHLPQATADGSKRSQMPTEREPMPSPRGPVPRSQSRIPGVTYDYLSGTEGSGSHRRAAPRLKRACIETSLMVDASPFRVPRSR
jgi:hypothetical protein